MTLFNLIQKVYTYLVASTPRCSVTPSDGHHAVCVECEILSLRKFHNSRKIYLFQRADWVGYKNQMESLSNSMLSSDSAIPVNDMWQTFKDELHLGLERYVPSKMTKPVAKTPWVTRNIRIHINKLKNYIKKKEDLR